MKLKRRKTRFLIIWVAVMAVLLAAIILLGLSPGEEESIKEVMQDGVLHETHKIDLFGLVEVNPALISAYIVTAFLLLCAAAIRIFVIPRFKEIPGKFQTVLEKLVEFFSDMAKTNSPHKTNVVAAYIFSAGVYIFTSTIFELLGVQIISTQGASISLPAPLADINGAIGMGLFSYLFILVSGIVYNGVKGGISVLKDFSLPISMSFRLFGALLSGALVTELVYYYSSLSFVLPVLVGILFTLLHAIIQTYVLATLASIFYGEAAEPKKKKLKEGN